MNEGINEKIKWVYYCVNELTNESMREQTNEQIN